jgi:NSS family neurotransmitter:Na+ symporter
MYQELEKPGSKWHIHGIVCLIGSTLLMMYYTTVAGWMLQYFVRMAAGQFDGKDTETVGNIFGEMLQQPGLLVLSIVIIVALGFFICSIGLQSGLERVTKVLMILLLIIMVVLAVNSLFLKGASEGLSFYLIPDFGRMKESGIFHVIVAAMNQAFFTLSIGIGSMAIFGSYIDKERTLLGESVNVVLLDTFVAITAGLIILPACFAYGVEPTEGPGLIFVTLPNIFNDMPLGRLWGSLFFVFMCFAAFSTVLGVFENIIACVMELTSWSRKKTGLICTFVMILLSLPCALGFNVLSNIQPLGAGSGIMDLEDLIVSNFLLPLGSLVFVLFCTHRAGWGWDKFVEEANTGKGIKVPSWLRPYLTYVLPVIIIVVFVVGIISVF